MMTEQDIQRALKAARVVPLTISNPHGPLGLEQLESEFRTIRNEPRYSKAERVQVADSARMN